MLKLVFLSGPLSGGRRTVDTVASAGRGPSNAIVLQDDAVSVVHCEFRVENGRAFVRDLGSTNGTRLNGQRIVSSELHDGDGLILGKSKIRVELPNDWQTPAMHTDRIPARGAEVIAAAAAAAPAPAASGTPVAPAGELSGNIFGTVTYYLKRRIASGGMGAIYEAEQFGAEGFIKTVAIKTILPSFARRESFIASFVGEAKLVANLVHQNIVQIHHLGRHENGYYIAMEYIDGINLSEFLARHRRAARPVAVDMATFIVSRICRGLEYAHTKTDAGGAPLHLVHRDVSPSNIMITREGEVKLTDFGVARAAMFMEDEGGYLVGSLEYMSPEQAACEAIDHRSDLFTLGLVYHELLTGRRVFRFAEDDVEKAVERIRTQPIHDPREVRPDVPESVAAIVMRALERDPAGRYATAADMCLALERDMYAKGYGPTIMALSNYVRELSSASQG